MAMAMAAVIAAIHAPAAASAAVAAQVIDENASAHVAMRDEVCRRRKWLRLAWARNQSWMMVAEAAAAAMPVTPTAACQGDSHVTTTTKGANTSAIAPIT